MDIVALNCWAEIETLDSALEATPTGLEGVRFPGEKPKKMPAPPMGHCSAFAGTGPATADGKIVFGHITMFGLPASSYYNVWLDVKPEKGHRVVMQSFPGGIQSGMDYYLTDAGLMVSETTITQTRFNKDGLALASRIRKAVQYAATIDQVVEYLTKDNNGLYTNEWLIGDAKTNEIAMLQLGTARHRLSRSSKNEWFGGTPGFYWGCNNLKDLDLRLETIPGANDRPANLVWRPSDRDRTWQRLYHQHAGKIDEKFAKLAFTTPPLAAYHSLDAKYTTTDMAMRLATHALFGPPLGRTWLPTDEEKKTHPEVRPLVSHPWTVLTAAVPPAKQPGRAVDLTLDVEDSGEADDTKDDSTPPTVPAWYGTILPKTDGDIWLASAFSEYEKIVALENALKKRASDSKLGRADRERVALDLHAFRANFTGSGPTAVTLSAVRRDDRDDGWYRRAVGKGVWVLHELRQRLGKKLFDEAMDSFGRTHAGKEVTTAEFQKHIEQAAKKDLGEFFDYWVRGGILPHLAIQGGRVEEHAGKYAVVGRVTSDRGGRATVRVAVRAKGEDVTKDVAVTDGAGEFRIECSARPTHVRLDPEGDFALDDGPYYSVRSFLSDLEHTLIVYGTADEEAANRDAAWNLQQALRAHGPNITVAVQADTDTTDHDRQENHLLLIGRPETNRLSNELGRGEAVHWGPRSFAIRDEHYANAQSAVLYAVPNGTDGRSAVVIAGLGATSTRDVAVKFTSHLKHAASAVVIPASGAAKYLVLAHRPEQVLSGK